MIEKNDSTTLFTPGESAIRATTSAKKTTVLTVEMTAFRRWERLRASPREPPGGPASPAGKPPGLDAGLEAHPHVGRKLLLQLG